MKQLTDAVGPATTICDLHQQPGTLTVENPNPLATVAPPGGYAPAHVAAHADADPMPEKDAMSLPPQSWLVLTWMNPEPRAGGDGGGSWAAAGAGAEAAMRTIIRGRRRAERRTKVDSGPSAGSTNGRDIGEEARPAAACAGRAAGLLVRAGG